VGGGECGRLGGREGEGERGGVRERVGRGEGKREREGERFYLCKLFIFHLLYTARMT